MVVLSCLRPCAQQGMRRVILPTFQKSTTLCLLKAKPLQMPHDAIQMRPMSNKFEIKSGMYTERSWRDDLLFYFQLGILPWFVVIVLVNIFIGDAELTDIPEGYTPKHWEYQRHPISRFFAKYFFNSYEKDYEMAAHLILLHDRQRKQRLFNKEVKRLCDMNQNIVGWYRLAPNRKAREKITEQVEEHADTKFI